MNIRLATRGTGVTWTGFQAIVLAISAEKLCRLHSWLLVFLQNKVHRLGP